MNIFSNSQKIFSLDSFLVQLLCIHNQASHPSVLPQSLLTVPLSLCDGYKSDISGLLSCASYKMQCGIRGCCPYTFAGTDPPDNSGVQGMKLFQGKWRVHHYFTHLVVSPQTAHSGGWTQTPLCCFFVCFFVQVNFCVTGAGVHSVLGSHLHSRNSSQVFLEVSE